jgi:methylamine dehydrogenase accessory protein MauD
MHAALLIARLLLAVVFVVAGAAKLADLGGSRKAVANFGVPTPLAAPLGTLLPLAELTVAVALLPAATAWWGAVGALVLLLLFVVGIGANMARGRKPECHCFGQLHSEPAGWKTLARNGVLAAVAGFVVWGGYAGAGPSAMGWLAGLSIAQVAGLIVGLAILGVMAAQWWFLLSLLRQNGRLLVRVQALEWGISPGGAVPSPNGVEAGQASAGLPIGDTAPDFELPGLHGETLTLESLRAAEKPVMLVFTDPNCGPCTAMLPEIRRWQKEHTEELTISLVSRGTVEENRAKSTEHGLRGILLQQDWEVSEAYEVEATPSAVLVRSDGTIGSPVVEGEDDISALLAYAVGVGARRPMHPGGQEGAALHSTPGDAAAEGASKEPRVGVPAPQMELQGLNGATVSLTYFRGEKTVVLFWDPECGFCREMLLDLRAWEDEFAGEAPKLLVVSTGTEEANRDMGLKSPVVLDEQATVARAFSAPGTPSAVLIDEQGNIASELAVGAPAVLALIRAPREAAQEAQA